ncbi:MAG: pyruvate kinase [Cryomorphaceae bacterium]|nr:pyruvate kinase [Cryomorphaceae bacterium]
MITDKKTKIVATLGPASANFDTMTDMVKSGVNVFRVNCSHSNPEGIRETIRLVREVNEKNNFSVAVLADLQGPKLRVGEIEDGAMLTTGNTFILTSKPCVGNSERAYLTYETFARDVKPGERILLDDGKLMLEVEESNQVDTVKTRVIQGGSLKSRKGVNLPNTKISLPCLTKKDLEDLEAALQEEVEWVGLSFVRSGEDIRQLRGEINARKSLAKIISKIEKPEAVEDIDDILTETDAVMVARGDLGVEVPMERVPVIQKMIVKKALAKSVPIIIATQMMETMMENLSPTRAEVNDVANSMLDGADAVMLSGETSVGKYPVQVVQMMRNIIVYVEENANFHFLDEHPPTKDAGDRYITDSICYNASKIADQIGAKAILTMTHSGYTGFKISSHRPRTTVAVFTANRSILNMLSLVWGVQTFYYDKLGSTDQSFADIKEMVVQAGLAKKGDRVIKIASMPIKELGMTNTLKISEVE